MLRLVFTICMIDAPAICEQREMLVYEAMSVTSCAMGAMPELAVWSQTHPNWRIARWHCEDDRTARSDRRVESRKPHARAPLRASSPRVGS
jgi:hypothetical protein